jgi:eukaryotic-like serine/threonine-protein kinase
MEQSKSNEPSRSEPTITIGRYVLHREIARGGMATIHFGRLLGDEGFSRIVAVKRLHAELAQDEQFVAMFLDEARIASRVQHRNVVPVLDVATVGQEVILVQEYVHGAPLDLLLANLRRDEQRLPIELAVAIACQVLAGLQGTHDTVDELGKPMHIVHRDVSPQNVMIALDGSARLLDFGIATSGIQSQVSSERLYKGKLAYSAPEQLQRAATQQSDIYSASVLLWELLVGARMHGSKKGAELVSLVLRGALPRIRATLTAGGHWDALTEAERVQLEALEPIVQKGLSVDLSKRWLSAREMEEALAAHVAPASAGVLAEWVKTTGESFLAHRTRILAIEEERWRRLHPFDNARSSDPDAQGSARSMRISSLPGVPKPAAPATVKRLRRGHVAVLAGCGAALAFALVLLVPTSPARQSEVQTLDGARQRVEQRPAASQAATTAAAAPQLASDIPAALPLALPRRATAGQPPRSEGALADSSDQARVRAATLPPPGGVAQPRPLNVLRASQGPVKDSAAREPNMEAPAAKRSDDCEVPYYYEGTKKIFKSACI